jgi:hypothetical protein
MVSVSVTGTAAPAPIHLWFEAEQLLHGEGWMTSDFWAPSAGRFIYQEEQFGPPATACVDLPQPDRWVVWMRSRDETPGQRQAYAVVNGRRSCIMGGTHSGQWVWYAVGVVHGSSAEVAVTQITPAPMNEWIDALVFTNDPAFVPPGTYTGDGYCGYGAASDAERHRRPAWIWWPTQPDPGSVGYYRKTLSVPTPVDRATLSVAALGRSEVWLNGKPVGSDLQPQHVTVYRVARNLRPGDNVLAVRVEHSGTLPGLWVRLDGVAVNGQQFMVVSDMTWQATEKAGADWVLGDFSDLWWNHPCARIGEQDMIGLYEPSVPMAQ